MKLLLADRCPHYNPFDLREGVYRKVISTLKNTIVVFRVELVGFGFGVGAI